ncbi:hypothetical protein ACLM5J_09680 [Nocardioides sp. Bht2]|uniref:phage holin n=1 Tax=Nocardioides sp. Bht2 TaxID=3392297 RepID=UPI0039B3E96F
MIQIPPAVRDRLYPIALAVVALLGGYGLISESMIPLWIALASAVVGVGTATAYRPSKTLPDK